MAPEHKTSREEIIGTALSIVEEGGVSALTAREIGKRLGLSSRPIYSFFPSMDHLKLQVIDEIGQMFKEYLLTSQSEDLFLDMGLGQIRFAREKPVLYRILLNEAEKNPFMAYEINNVLVSELKNHPCYGVLSGPALEDILLKMGIFTNGLAEAVLSKTISDVSDGNILRLLSETGEAVILRAMQKIEEEGV
ncbi:MAG: TetR/AcrR family transcriptional regulator [Spirochaetes bacterium]|nr:TetR/AcrR family transcriptional regulator [Spirochaetota bacterium]MBN2772449.1 TetR/AcrR family transcriptional regulator [Spirochaetota bacterium]